MALRLSDRLSALAAMVTPGYRLADIGTDHGYIPIELCVRGQIPSALAMDVNPGPLLRAQEHIREYHLEEKIETRLSDGLQKLEPGEADTILIAGMGGLLIQRILEEGAASLAGIRELIVQPQSDVCGTRVYLREHGFSIVSEDMVEEEGKYYPMMRAIPTDEPQKATTLEDMFGPELLKNQHPVLIQWLHRELAITERILEQLRQVAPQDEILSRITELTEKKMYLQEALTLSEAK